MLERMEETVHLVPQDPLAWTELLDRKVRWVHLVSREYKVKQEQLDLGV